ncbi:MAG: P-loop NTPase fold protein [bacterium]|nr:P-loop NTPase fold protein [bacterium]
MAAVPFRHPGFVVNPGSPFKNDKVGREAFVRELCRRVMAQEQAAVVAITGGFGSGKSVALQMCASVLRADGATVTEFNAWQQSYTRDPLIDLVSALSKEQSEVWKRVAEIALRLASPVVSSLTGGLVRLDSVVDGKTAPESDPFAGWATTDQHVGDFKEALATVVTDTRGRFVVLIDELDRCVPEYAMDLLNVARHLFDVPGVVIVLGVNRAELGHRVRQIYGDKCDADTYLRRFVDLPIDLPIPESQERDGYTRGLLASAEPTQHADFLAAALDLLIGEARISLRDAEQILRRVAQLIPDARQSRSYWYLGTVAMLVLREVDRKAYEAFAAGRIDAFEAVAALRASLPATLVAQSKRASTVQDVEDLLLLMGDERERSAARLTSENFQERWVDVDLGDPASAEATFSRLMHQPVSAWEFQARDIAAQIESVVSARPAR